MPSIKLVLDGDSGELSKQLTGKKIHTVHTDPTLTALRGGMQSGATSVALVIPMHDGSVVFFESSFAALLAAVNLLKAHHGDPTDTIPTEFGPIPPFQKVIEDRGAVRVSLYASRQLKTEDVARLMREQAEAIEEFAKGLRETAAGHEAETEGGN